MAVIKMGFMGNMPVQRSVKKHNYLDVSERFLTFNTWIKNRHSNCKNV